MRGELKGRAWQRMLSGRRLDLIDPSPLDIEISDIAHGLARVARWNGQTRGAEVFSVAQHCLLVEALVGAQGLAVPARHPRESMGDVGNLDVERGGVDQVEPPPRKHALPRARGLSGHGTRARAPHMPPGDGSRGDGR